MSPNGTVRKRWCLVLILLLVPGLLAQDPLFRVRVETIPIYVSVTDDQGRPIRGLALSDFEIRENRVLQEIESVQELERGQETKPRVDEPDEEAAGQLPSPAAGGSEPSYIVIRFDPLLNVRDLGRAKKTAREFIRHTDPAADLLSVSWRDSMSEFTRDRTRIDRLIEAVDPTLLALSIEADSEADPARQEFFDGRDAGTGIRPQGLSVGGVPDVADIFSDLPTLDMIQGEVGERINQGSRSAFYLSISRLKYLTGRKIVLFLGKGLVIPQTADRLYPYDPKLNARLYSDAGFVIYAVDPSGLKVESGSGQLPGTGRRGGRRSMRARSEATFVIPGANMTNAYLKTWTESTGGFAIYNRNNLQSAAREIARRTEHYYLLTYSAKDPTYDGKYRRIEVKVPGRQLQVSHRGGYFATIPSADELRERSLRTAFLLSEKFRDFPLSVEAHLQNEKLEVRVAFPFEKIQLYQRSVPAKAVEERFFQDISVHLVVFSDKGRLSSQFSDSFHLDLDAKQLAELRTQNATIDRSFEWVGDEPPAVVRAVVLVGQNHQLSAVNAEVIR